MNPLTILQQNKLMETSEAVIAFEEALAELAHHPNPDNLPQYHLVFDDHCQQPEVMFSLIHLIESFEIEQQLKAFLQVIPQLMRIAPEWTRILHSRILNDQASCELYQQLLHEINLKSSHFIYYLLEDSVAHHLNSKFNPALIR